jgi:hypothetical protein
MWRRVGHVRTDVSEECAASTQKMKATPSSEISVLTRHTLRHIPEDGILRDKVISDCQLCQTNVTAV